MFDPVSKHLPTDSRQEVWQHEVMDPAPSPAPSPAPAEKMTRGHGFVAALDQSGGSTPRALQLYGIAEDAYSGDEQMFDLVHQMRTRIITSPSFDGERILATILFQDTMDRDIEGRPTADYLWTVKNIVPILKVDKGLAAEQDGAQLMKPIPDLDSLLTRARVMGIFGTKMRSLITMPGKGLDAVVSQQFDVADQILAAGLVPIIEPEVDIHSPAKAQAEEQLTESISTGLGRLGGGRPIMLKLTLPETDDLYRDLVDDPRVMRVLALSGGYTRAEACQRLSRNHGMIASFSRALTEGLTAQQSEHDFDTALDESIAEIESASRT
jgi:fructose-bisphosphate aldolase class I